MITSDHLPVFCFMATKKQHIPLSKTKLFEYRKYTDASILLLNDRLKDIDWNYLNDLNTEDAYQQFMDTINRTMNDTIPILKKQVKVKNVIRDPWMSKGLLTSSCRVSKLYTKAAKTPKTSETYQHYLSYKNRFNYIKRIAKQTYYASLFEKYKGNAKMVWKTNKLSLNTSKTNYMLCTNTNVNSLNVPDITITDQIITRTSDVKFLGIVIDKK